MSDLAPVPKRTLLQSYPSVNTRIVVPFLLAIVAIAAIGIYIVTRLVTGSIQERFTNQLVASANAAANTIVDVETAYLNTLRLMVFTDGVPAAIREGRSGDLDTWLRPIAATNVVDELMVVSAGGDVLLYLQRQDTPQVVEYIAQTPPDISDWANLQRTLAGDMDRLGDKFVDVIDGSDSANTLVYFNAPVTVDSGGGRTVVGGIVLGLRTEMLVRRVSQQALSAITLLNSNGEVLGSTFRTDLNLLTKTPEQTGRLMIEVFENSPIEEVILDDIPYQLLYSPFFIRSQQLGLMSVGLPSNYIVEQSSTSRNLFGIMFAVFFLLVGIIGLLIARTITNPIQRLVSTTRAIREGDLSRRVQLQPRDELGELGVSFDIMTDQLVSRNEEVTQLLQQQVEETAQRQAVLTSISDAVIVQDSDGRVILLNHTAEGLLNYLSKQRNDRERVAELLRDPERLRQPQMVSVAERHFSVLSTPVLMGNNELLGHVIVFRDITAIIHSEQLKDELVLQMSHELRTPLGAVRGYVDLVQLMDEANLSEQGAQFIERARDSLSTLERLVNQVIDVSAMISNRFSIDIETFNLAYLIGDVFIRWQPLMKSRNLQFMLLLSTNDMFIEGDPVRVDELLDHILRNAYSYTLPGGMVEISAEMTRTHAIISVADSGTGIGPDEIERVFERMYRGRAAMAGDTDARGLGLGLFISHQIVDAHGGHISIESEIKLGTIVTVELPIRQS